MDIEHSVGDGMYYYSLLYSGLADEVYFTVGNMENDTRESVTIDCPERINSIMELFFGFIEKIRSTTGGRSDFCLVELCRKYLESKESGKIKEE